MSPSPAKGGMSRTEGTQLSTSVGSSVFSGFTSGFSIFSKYKKAKKDRFELLEHTLFWTLTLFSWVIFINADKLLTLQNSIINKKQVTLSAIVLIVIVIVLNISIISHKNEAYHERREGVTATMEGENLYKCTFPFLAGSTSFEKTLDQFQKDHPNKKIKQIYTVPNKLRKQKADALIVYITTEIKN